MSKLLYMFFLSLSWLNLPLTEFKKPTAVLLLLLSAGVVLLVCLFLPGA